MRRRPQARPGDFLRTCDRSGFTVWASETVKEWTGAIVHKDFYEPRHPQDTIRVRRREDMRMPDPRPEPVTIFTGPLITEIDDDIAGDNDQFAPMGPLGAFTLGQTDDGGSNNVESNAAGANTITVASYARFEIGDRLGIVLNSGDMFFAQIEYFTGPKTLQLTQILPGSTSAGNRVFNYTSATSS